MKKLCCTLSLLAVVGLLAGAYLQARCTGVPEKKPYCEKCDKVVETKEVKSGKHSADETKVQNVEICVKKNFSFSCHPNKEGAGPGKS